MNYARSRIRRAGTGALVLAAVSVVAPTAEAGLIFGTGTNTSFTGEVGNPVVGGGGTTATVTFLLNNTSPLLNLGLGVDNAVITGFGFELPTGAVVTNATLTVNSGTLIPAGWSSATRVTHPFRGL